VNSGLQDSVYLNSPTIAEDGSPSANETSFDELAQADAVDNRSLKTYTPSIAGEDTLMTLILMMMGLCGRKFQYSTKTSVFLSTRLTPT
jgi:hypothetical protein